jgi:NTP pyrophosphatase (non-canonical NTP hydrolase)
MLRSLSTTIKDLEEKAEALECLPAKILTMCKKRGWSLHWTHRGAYLHLESSELIEAIRGKRGDPADEAGDVLLVLMSITENAGIPFSTVLIKATAKLQHLENSPPYAGEERLGKEGYRKPCPLCGQTGPHLHTSGPGGMS